MSSQKGNTSRKRPQKHQNRTAFKNNLHDTSQKTKLLNSLQITNVCGRCKEKIQWKIKYKKYKPLTQPKTCAKCNKKTIKSNYHVICGECAKTLKVCCKCLQGGDAVVIVPEKVDETQLDAEMKSLLKTLSERKRRTFLCYMNKSKGEQADKPEVNQDDLMDKLKSLQVEEDDEFGNYFDDDFDSDEFDDST